MTGAPASRPADFLDAAERYAGRGLAEREAIALSRDDTIGAFVIPYLNRLSDTLFVMARYENHERGIPEPLWDSRL